MKEKVRVSDLRYICQRINAAAYTDDYFVRADYAAFTYAGDEHNRGTRAQLCRYSDAWVLNGEPAKPRKLEVLMLAYLAALLNHPPESKRG